VEQPTKFELAISALLASAVRTVLASADHLIQ